MIQKIAAKERLKISITSLSVYNIEPNIIKSMLNDLELLKNDTDLSVCNECGRDFYKSQTEARCRSFCCIACEEGY